MSIIGKYKNGNYNVTIFSDGTKIRENDLDFFKAEFPESMDIKITNKCNMNCPMCHENSKPDGIHGDIMNAKFIESLHPHTELAIGGGNPLEHPQLTDFLLKCQTLKLIPSMTINQKHFMDNLSTIEYYVKNKLIYGLGVSLTNPTDEFIEEIKKFPNAVIHVINGLVTYSQLEKLSHNNLKILILGYKEFRRGEDLYKKDYDSINSMKSMLWNKILEIIKESWFDVVSFDNLAIKQLEANRLMSKEAWNEFYMGDDGSATMYVDMVNNEFAKSSVSTDRFPITDNIIDMFEKVRI